MKTNKFRFFWLSFPIVIFVFSFLVSSVSASEADLYVADTDGTAFHKLDPSDMSVISTISLTDIHGISDIYGSNGAAVDPTDNTVYSIIRFDNDRQRRWLSTINMETGEVTVIGAQLNRNFAGLAFDGDGQLYGITGDGDGTDPSALYTINKETAVTAAVASYYSEPNPWDGEAITYNYDDGKIYRLSGNNLYAIDPDDPTNPEPFEDNKSIPGDDAMGIGYRGNNQFYVSGDWNYRVYSFNFDNRQASSISTPDSLYVKSFLLWTQEPQVRAYLPQNEEVNVLVGQDLSLVFDRSNMAVGTGNITVKNASDDSVLATIDITSGSVTGWGTNTLAIDIGTDLPLDAEVYVNIDGTAIKDGNDNFLPEISDDLTWVFYTRSTGNTFSFSDSFETDNFFDYSNTNTQWDESNGSIVLPSTGFSALSDEREPFDSVFPGFNGSNGAEMAIDASGNPIIVSMQYDDISGENRIYISRWNGSAWARMDGTTPGYERIFEDLDGNNFYDWKIVIDSSGNPMVTAWAYVATNWEIVFSRWNGSAWTRMDGTTPGYDNVSNTGGNSHYPEIALDNSGNPIIVWYDDTSGQSVYISRWTGFAWDGFSSEGYDEVTNEYTYERKLIVDNSGNPIVFWRNGANDIAVSRWNGSAWTEMNGTTPGFNTIAVTAGNSYSFQVAIDGDDNPSVVWADDTTANLEIYFSRWNGSAWEGLASEGYDNISDNAGYSDVPKISLDDLGNPIVVWHDDTEGNNEIFLSRWNGSAWTRMNGTTPGYENISSDSENNDYYPNIVTDVLGIPTVAWRKDFPQGSDVFASRWNGSDWTMLDGITLGAENVSETHNANYPKLGLDVSDNPIIVWDDSYYPNNRTFVARYSPGYNSPSTFRSKKVSGMLAEDILSAVLTADDDIPDSSSIQYYLSNDGGSNWTEVSSGEVVTFATTGQDLRWKAILTEGSTPTIYSVDVDYSVAAGVSPVVSGPVKPKASNIEIDETGKLSDEKTNYVSEKKQKFSGTNTDAAGGEVWFYVRTKKGGKKLVETTTIGSDGKWEFSYKFDDDGTNYVYFRIVDADGNQSNLSKKIKIRIDTEDPEFIELKESVTITPSVPVRFPAEDGDSGIDYYRVKLFEQRNWRNQEEDYYYIPAGVPFGNYTLDVRVYDKAGNSTKKNIAIRYVASLASSNTQAVVLPEKSPENNTANNIISPAPVIPENIRKTIEVEASEKIFVPPVPIQAESNFRWWNPFTWF